MTPRIFSACALALMLAACAAEEERPAQQSRPQALEAQPAPAAPDFDLEAERAAKKAWQQRSPAPRVDAVDWQAAQSMARGGAELLDAEALRRLQGAPVPALLPERAELTRRATVTVGPHWYTASLDGDGLDIYISGTRLVFDVPGLELPADHSEQLDNLRLSRNEAIVSLAFEAFGAAYVIEVECARPAEDPRCTEDDYVIALADALVIVGRGEDR